MRCGVLDLQTSDAVRKAERLVGQGAVVTRRAKGKRKGKGKPLIAVVGDAAGAEVSWIHRWMLCAWSVGGCGTVSTRPVPGVPVARRKQSDGSRVSKHRGEDSLLAP